MQPEEVVEAWCVCGLERLVYAPLELSENDRWHVAFEVSPALIKERGDVKWLRNELRVCIEDEARFVAGVVARPVELLDELVAVFARA